MNAKALSIMRSEDDINTEQNIVNMKRGSGSVDALDSNWKTRVRNWKSANILLLHVQYVRTEEFSYSYNAKVLHLYTYW